jgi:hypothetical protein
MDAGDEHRTSATSGPRADCDPSQTNQSTRSPRRRQRTLPAGRAVRCQALGPAHDGARSAPRHRPRQRTLGLAGRGPREGELVPQDSSRWGRPHRGAQESTRPRADLRASSTASARASLGRVEEPQARSPVDQHTCTICIPGLRPSPRRSDRFGRCPKGALADMAQQAGNGTTRTSARSGRL